MFYTSIPQTWNQQRKVDKPIKEIIKKEPVWNNRYIVVNKCHGCYGMSGQRKA